jgi:hypothetical protein
MAIQKTVARIWYGMTKARVIETLAIVLRVMTTTVEGCLVAETVVTMLTVKKVAYLTAGTAMMNE